MRILVTGGAGFIVSHFVNLMCDLGHEVIILDCLTYAGLQDILDPRATFIYGNVCDVMLVNDLVHKVNMVVHFAAETHVARSIVNSRLFFETDVIGTQTVCEAVRRNPEVQLIHISTSEVYGTDWDVTRPMNEHHPLNPMSPYAAAKCGADRTVYSYIETYGIKEVNLFVLDVEGHELQVLRGMKGCPVIPRVMCIESDKIPKVELDSLMGSLGFRADSVFRNNTIFVREL